MDTLFERWRSRRATPLDDAGVHRFHRRRFGWSVVNLVYVLILLLLAGNEIIQEGPNTLRAIVVLVLGALVLYLSRVAARRWRRLKTAA